MKKTLSIITLLTLGCTGNAQQESTQNLKTNMEHVASIKNETSARYEVTFTSLWNQREHLAVPASAHFSPLVVTVHNENHRLFPKGNFTKAGLKLVAELGNTSIINNEIASDTESGYVLSSMNTENQFILNTKAQKITVTITEDFSLVSLVSMIAPSPDWIVGVDSIRLFDGVNFLENSGVIKLYAYNAGTEDGDFGGNYSINNPPTVNPTPIEQLQGRGFDSPFATVEFKKIK